MSWLSGLQNIFSGSQTTNQSSTNQGTSSAQSSAQGANTNTQTTDPRLKAFADWAASQGQTAFNPAQSLVQGAAGAVNDQWQKYLTPFASDQIKANLAATAPAEAQQRSYRLGATSGNPYGSTSRGRGSADQMFEASLAAQHGQMAAGVNSQAYTQALQAAQQDAMRQLQAGMGSGSLTTQQLGLYPSIIGAGGQTTSGAGTTSQTGNTSGQTYNTGNSSGTTTYNPSIGSIGMGLAGLFMRDGGSVKGYESGGAVKSDPSSFAGKVEDAFHTFHRMRKHAENGGKADEQRYDDGGWVPTVTPYLGGPPSSDDSYWNGVQNAAIANGNPSASPFAPASSMRDKLGTLGKAMEPPKTASAPPPLALPTGNPSLDAMSGVMGSVGTALRPHAAGGGVMGNDAPSFASTLWSGLSGLIGGGADTPREAPVRTPARDVLRDNYDYEKPDARWQLRRGLLGVSSGVPGLPGPFSSFGTAMDKELESRAEAAKLLEQNAQQTGRFANGQQTLAGKAQPSEIALREAQTELAKTQANKEWMLELEKRKMEYQRELDLAKTKAQWEQMFELRKRMQQEEQGAAPGAPPANGRLQWRPVAPAAEPPAPAPAPPAPVAPAPAPAAPPPAPLRNNRGQLVRGTPEAPYASKGEAGFGQYYRGPDNVIYRRGNLRTGDSVYYGGQ